MLLLFEIISLTIALILLIPSLVLFTECTVAALPKTVNTKNNPSLRPSISILIPAHNEAAGISNTLDSLIPQLTPSDRLVVVADNCTDSTAAIARNLGAIVLERENSTQRGKGYALDYGMQFLAKEPPEVVVFVDADCLVSSGTIAEISFLAYQTQRPVQAIYLIQQPPQPTAKDVISALAILVKNLVRPLGLRRLGFPCLLGGTGMAFPWAAIAKAPLASGNIVEDMQLGLDLAVAGTSPLFSPDAQVLSVLPQQEQNAKSQRTRWEHGHLQTLLQEVPRLFKAAIAQKRLDLFALALEVAVPPLSLLVLLWLTSFLLAFILTLCGGSFIPLGVLVFCGLLIFLSIFLAWAKYGRDQVSLLTLLTIPLYVLWKIPLYFGFLLKRQTRWNKTERDQNSTVKLDPDQTI